MTKNLKFDRREKWLLRLFAFFAVIILVSQILQFINNRNNDAEYRKMLVSGIIMVETSQKLMGETYYLQRSIRDLLTSYNPVLRDSFLIHLTSYRTSSEQEIAEIRNIVFTTGQDKLLNDLQSNTKEYEKICRICMDMVLTDIGKAQEYRAAVVRPAFERFQKVQGDLVSTLSNDLQVESSKVAAASTTSSLLILLLGISPFVIFVIYLVFQSSKIVYNEFS